MARLARPLAFVVVTGVTTLILGSLAFAQQPKTPAKPPTTKPVTKPPSKTDAAAPAETTSSEAGAPTAPTDAGASEPPPTPEVLGDGGVRPSPLNPRPEEMPGQSTADAGVPVDYDRLLADIAALRARVSALSDNFYQSRILVALQTDGDHGKIGRLTVAVDDGIVYTAPGTFSAPDMTTVYDHAVAPGRHAVTIDVDRKDTRDEGFRTSQKNRFTVEVPRDHRLEVQVKVLDDSSMGGDFPSDKSGKYDLRVKVKAFAKPAGK